MQNPDELIEQYQLAKKDRARLERRIHRMIFDPSKETRPEVLAAEEEYFGCKPCFANGRNRHVFQSGFNAGAASRDAEIAELVAALKPFGAIDLVESRLASEFAMLILRARAAIAKARKP